ncbi:unnamed protein product [Vitrella brassicaformis CCMP3155]|uniref:Ion transport domain-containing protein n=3 Tax=Vitrella brassicaformis TaxID=1169539 RepID=A0A0G4EBH6_VITBC|nr:unnamed protein product [Vitrella brassicaformis CCMP3155]|eukprot:CEL92871.1 unnamed protein product [Vitrella brassicaformis CCMP3155]
MEAKAPPMDALGVSLRPSAIFPERQASVHSSRISASREPTRRAASGAYKLMTAAVRRFSVLRSYTPAALSPVYSRARSFFSSLRPSFFSPGATAERESARQTPTDGTPGLSKGGVDLFPSWEKENEGAIDREQVQSFLAAARIAPLAPPPHPLGRRLFIPGSAKAVSLSRNGRWLVLAMIDGHVFVYDALEREKLFEDRIHIDQRRNKGGGLAISDDGSRVCALDGQGGLHMWDVKTSKKVAGVNEGGGWMSRILSDVQMDSRGKIILTGGDDLAVFAFADGNLLHRHDCGSPVRCLDLCGESERVIYPRSALSPSSSTTPSPILQAIAAPSPAPSPSLSIIRMATQELRRDLRPVSSVPFSAVCGVDDGSIRLFDLIDLNEYRVIRGHAGPIRAIAASKNGRFIATVAQRTGVLKLWQGVSGCEDKALQPHTTDKEPNDSPTFFTSVAINDDGETVYAGDRTGGAHLFSTETGSEERDLRLHEGEVRAVAMSGDGGILCTLGSDGCMCSARIPSEEVQLPGHTNKVRHLVISENGQVVASVSDDNDLKVWCVNPLTSSGGSAHPLTALDNADDAVESWCQFPTSITALAMSVKGDFLALGDTDGYVCLHSTASLMAATQSSPTSNSCSPTADRMTFSVHSSSPHQDDSPPSLNSNFAARTPPSEQPSVPPMPSPGSEISGGMRKSLRFTVTSPDETDGDKDKNKETAPAPSRGKGDDAPALRRAPSLRLPLGGRDGKRESEVDAAKPPQPLVKWEAHDDCISALAMQTNKRIVSGSPDDTSAVFVWDGLSGEVVARCEGEMGQVNGVAINMEAMIVLAVGDQGDLRIWAAETGEPLCVILSAHVGEANCLCLSRDALTVATGGDDALIRLWRVEHQPQTPKGAKSPRHHEHPPSIDLTTRERRSSIMLPPVGGGGRRRSSVAVPPPVQRPHRLSKTRSPKSGGQRSPKSASRRMQQASTHTLFTPTSKGDRRPSLGSRGSKDRRQSIGVAMLAGTVIDKPRPFRVLRGHVGPIACISCDDTCHLLASVAHEDDGMVFLWESTQETPIQVVDRHYQSSTLQVALTSGRLVATADRRGRLLLWRVNDSLLFHWQTIIIRLEQLWSKAIQTRYDVQFHMDSHLNLRAVEGIRSAEAMLALERDNIISMLRANKSLACQRLWPVNHSLVTYLVQMGNLPGLQLLFEAVGATPTGFLPTVMKETALDIALRLRQYEALDVMLNAARQWRTNTMSERVSAAIVRLLPVELKHLPAFLDSRLRSPSRVAGENPPQVTVLPGSALKSIHAHHRASKSLRVDGADAPGMTPEEYSAHLAPQFSDVDRRRPPRQPLHKEPSTFPPSQSRFLGRISLVMAQRAAEDEEEEDDSPSHRGSWRAKADTGYQHIDIRHFDLPNIMNPTVSGGFLRHLNQASTQDLFRTLTVRAILSFKWQKYGGPMYRRRLLLQLLFLLVFFIHSCVIVKYMGDDWRETVRSWNPMWGWITAAARLLLIILSLFLGLKILLLVRKRHFRAFFSVWTWLDISACVFVMAFIICEYLDCDRSVEAMLSSITAVLLWSKMIYFCRGFEGTGHQIRMIQEVVYDMRHFIAVMLIMIVGFGHAFHVLYLHPGYSRPSQWVEATAVSSTLIFLTSIGEFYEDVVSPEIQDPSPHFLRGFLICVLFVLATFFVTIVMFNLLISIMGDTHDRVKLQEIVAQNRERAELLLEYEQQVPRGASSLFPRYLFVGLVGSRGLHELDEQDEWEGRLSQMKKAVRAELAEHQQNVDKRLEVLRMSNRDAVRRSIQEALAEDMASRLEPVQQTVLALQVQQEDIQASLGQMTDAYNQIHSHLSIITHGLNQLGLSLPPPPTQVDSDHTLSDEDTLGSDDHVRPASVFSPTSAEGVPRILVTQFGTTRFGTQQTPDGTGGNRGPDTEETTRRWRIFDVFRTSQQHEQSPKHSAEPADSRRPSRSLHYEPAGMMRRSLTEK